MSNAARRAEFFALEAGEYLNDLMPLTAARDVPDVERLVRGARGLRGAALMAGLGTFARAAAALEGIARQVRDHALAWEPNAQAGWSEGLGVLRGLVARAAQWEAADDRQALSLAERLERIAGGMPARLAAAPVPAPPTLTANVRAFIARESVLIAGSFDQAARALAPIPPPEALTAVLERMQSLRGLGASAELSPLPELLDAMEVATRTLLGDAPPPPDVAAIFADASQALSQMARSIADHGIVTPPPTLERVAARLLDTYAAERDVVPIAMLAASGNELIAQRGVAPAPAGDLEPISVELVSVGDHLLLSAEALAKPTSAIARDLRLFVLHRTLSTMPPRSATGRFLAPIAEAITAAISHGVAARRPEAFVAMLRDCGRFLVDSGGEHDRGALLRKRDRIAAAIVQSDALPPAPFEAAAVLVPPSFAHPLVSDPGPPPAAPEIAPPPVVVPPPAPPAVEVTITFAPPEPVAPTPPPTPIVVAAPIAPPTPSAVFDVPVMPPSVPAAPFVAPTPVDDDLGEIVAIESLAPVADIADEPPIVDIASLAPADDDDLIGTPIVAIEGLAPDDAADDVVTIESLAPDSPSSTNLPAADAPAGRLSLAYARRATLIRERAHLPPSLDAFTARGATADEEPVVTIDVLFYRGPRALERADEVRAEIDAILEKPTVSLDALRPFIRELLDLIPLARDVA